MEYRQERLLTYADKLDFVDVSEVASVPVDSKRVDPNKRELFCGNCNRVTSHVNLGGGWLCYVSECGGYVSVTEIRSQSDLDRFLEDL